MFLGQYRYSFDEKDRLMIPPRFREMLADGAFVTQGFDRNLVVLTPGAFQEICQTIMALNVADPMARFLLRMILGNAVELQLDKDGRIVLPHSLREFAQLVEEVVLVGLGDYFEVWAPTQWSQQEVHLQDAETNSVRFAALDLARHQA